MDHPFTASNVNPLIIYFLKKIPIAIGGNRIIVAAAQSAPQSNPIASANFKDWTGKVLAFIPVNINANKNSFHVNIKHKSAVEASPYSDNGSVILKNIPNFEHPSISAASSISFGIAKKNPLVSQTVKGKIHHHIYQ